MWFEDVVGELAVSLLHLGINHLQWTLSNIAISATLGNLDRLDISHWSVRLLIWLHLILHILVLVSDRTLLSHVSWRRFASVGSTLILKLLNFIFNGFLLATNEVFVHLWAHEAIVVILASWLLLGVSSWRVVGLQWHRLIHLRSLLLSIGRHWLGEFRSVGVLAWI